MDEDGRKTLDIESLKIMLDAIGSEIEVVSDEIAELEQQRAMKLSDRAKLQGISSVITSAISSYEKALEVIVRSGREEKKTTAKKES